MTNRRRLAPNANAIAVAPVLGYNRPMTITLTPTDAPDTESIVRRIIAELDANPGAREPLLRALLTEEFLLMPARLTRVEENVESLLEVPARLMRVEENVATLRGGKLETDFAHRATSIFNRMFGFRGCRVLHGRVGSQTHIAGRFSDQILDACENGLITDRQLRRIYDTDVIARCRRSADSATVWVAVEVAARVDSADIDRAAQSAVALRQVFGEDALAVVAGERIDPPDRGRAAQAGVTLFQMGEDDADEDGE